jgi:hypothetical protein
MEPRDKQEDRRFSNCPRCGYVWEERCGGMIREGVCTLPVGHDGPCGLADE